MTHEEAIKNINALNAVCGQKDLYDAEFESALALAIEALEKQVPKKPPNHDGMVCPSCNSKARYGHPYEYYCPHCGQAIDWEEN